MKWTRLKIVEETENGFALGYSDGGPAIDPAGVILPSRTGENAGIDKRDNAEIIVRSVNSYETLVKALNDALICIEDAVKYGKNKRDCDTRRWSAGADQIRYALDEAKRTMEWYAT
jgi:hypothetical protein